MTVQKRLSQIGFAKQTAKGTPATAPSYVVGLTGGTVYSADITENDLNTTWSDRLLPAHERTEVLPGSEAEIVCTPATIGLLLYLALGADAVTGSADPYTHTITPASALPWHTVFGSYGADKSAVADAKIDSLELSWEKTGALKAKVKSMGCTFTFASTWTGGTLEGVLGNTFRGQGGVFNVAGTQARVVSGSITIDNGCTAIVASYSTTPDFVAESMVKCDVSLTIVPDDLLLFRTVVTGSASGTSAQSIPQYGALDLKFINSASPTHDLEFTAANTRFMTKMPDVDPAGGAAEVTLEGSVAGTFSFVLRNAVASY